MPVAGDGTHIGNHVPTCGQAVIPDRDRAVIVLPENVALMVAVEVAGVDNMVTAWHHAGIGYRVPTRRQAVIPDRDCAVIVLPENVAFAVAVEVADADKMVTAWH